MELNTDEYDQEFIILLAGMNIIFKFLFFWKQEIETYMKDMDKHNKIRIQSWCKKFCQIVANVNWKKNRNLHALNLLDMILNEHFEEPYNKFPP